MKGLNNIGNTCYLNSALQLLIRNKDFMNLILKHQNKSDELKKISEFINEYYNGNEESLNPRYIKNLIGKSNSLFLGLGQQDSTEFILYFLNVVNDEINKYSETKNLVDKMFQYKIKVRIKCKLLKCLHKSIHYEYNTLLMLDLNENTNTLMDCINNSFQREILDGEYKYKCENCNNKVRGSKRSNIEFLPDHLIIILKRFKTNGRSLRKNCRSIEIPLYFKNHELKGFVHHSGSLSSGHYIYFGKEKDKWFLFNDSSVSEIKNNNDFENKKNNAYIFYFSRK